MNVFAVRIHMHFSQFCGVVFFEFGPSGKERNLKCRSNLWRSSRERSRGGSPSHDPFGPRKRITSSGRNTTSFAKGQNLKEWPRAPQFGHLELVKWYFSFCHSSILARRSERSSLSEIPFLAACSIRSFFRWFPVRRVLTIPETFWKLDIRCNPYGDRLLNCAQEIIEVLITWITDCKSAAYCEMESADDCERQVGWNIKEKVNDAEVWLMCGCSRPSTCGQEWL